MAYVAPVNDIQFALEVTGSDRVAQLPGFADATPDLINTIVEEAGKFANDILAPINWKGDQDGAQWTEDGVKTVEGWREAYQQFSANGWQSLGFDPEYGGQGMPRLVSAAVMEMWNAANMSFALCPLLTQGAIDAIHSHGSDFLKDTFLEKMISGEWTGTMNLTESQAGTDLASIRTSAKPNGDHYLLSGQKIFITYGDHDLTENTVHLVLARTPDAPAGVKGISLFVVPKFLLNQNGTLGERNDAYCVSIEHKLGIHASPTAVMAYGDNGGAVGYLVGEENHGLMYMFTMMNIARHSVGVQGYALAERAYQQARDFAFERVQGKAMLTGESGSRGIINHPDIRRILMTMRSQVEAMRLLGLECAGVFDHADRHEDQDYAAFCQRRGELLTPLVKGWSSEIGVELCSLGVQVHGGMGFIEETGAAQHLRDARITPIYEGTTAIQANDLIGRKLARDGGQGVKELIDAMLQSVERAPAELSGEIAETTALGIAAIEATTEWMLSQDSPSLPASASVNYLMMMGMLAGQWMMLRSAAHAHAKLLAGEGDAEYLQAKIDIARFYSTQITPRAFGLRDSILNGSDVAVTFAEAQF
ncbi:MAG: acyl-CoA dehydrogenase [Pseudomonadota bacterium]